jgi:hypothetical protein
MTRLKDRTVRSCALVNRGLPAEVMKALHDARHLRGCIRRLLAAARGHAAGKVDFSRR